ncbi:TonB-dependent receptor domain-containing protein [Janthinobacterium agaricidamnosum]|uniref:TonB-dependent heme/hemoglobin receptor family protein n=1 Tax=Janthinobacterium agaricidamnosum NBRC 102515 = DSM 9628 TaxID=1349767 RepID=W0V454_9BURK|nr:TonB-dependent receptor [Janthinobacterium agaricidamnosum]CDG82133.1 tonB-dependent heme/hemoglobin receptor family protein [Janthinobacterium agaricidamnosum NBRC 102515 = DSM 9628]
MKMKQRGACVVRPMVLALAMAFCGHAVAADEETTPEVVLPAISVFGDTISAANVGRSYLKSEDVERQQANNVAALLDNLPGVDLAGTSRPSGQTLNIWGFNKVQDVKVILDGVPKGFEKYRQGSIFVEPELIKQIEVNKGPHTSLYGNGGFGGVVTIDTKDARDMLKGEANVGAFVKYAHQSNNAENDATVAVYGRTEDGRYDAMAYVTQRKSGDLEKPDGKPFRFSAVDTPSSLIKLNVRLTDEQLLTLSAMRGRSTGWGPFAALGEDVPVPTDAEIKKYGWDEAWQRKAVYRDQQDDTYAVKWHYAPRDNPLVNLTATYGRSYTEQHDKRPDSASQASFLGSLGNESWASYNDQLAEVRNESLFSTGALAHVLSIGAQWHKNVRDTLMYYPSPSALKDPTYNFGYFQPYYMPAGQQKTEGLYLQDAMTYGSVTMTAALRYDRVTTQGVPNVASRYNSPLPAAGHDFRAVTHSDWSPRVGLFWKATSSLALFADASRTWRAPTIDEMFSNEFYVTPALSSSTPGTSRDLKVERITAVRLGAMASRKGLFSERDDAQVRLTFYQNRDSDNIGPRLGVLVYGYVPGSGMKLPPGLSDYRNLSGFRTAGMELESFYNTPDMYASASLSMQTGRRNGTQRDPWGDDEPVATIAPNKLITSLGWKLPVPGTTLGWQGKFVSKQDKLLPLGSFYRLPPSQGYGLHTLFASWHGSQGVWRDTDLRLTVDNIFNRDYKPYLSEGVTGVGRNYKLSLSRSF